MSDLSASFVRSNAELYISYTYEEEINRILFHECSFPSDEKFFNDILDFDQIMNIHLVDPRRHMFMGNKDENEIREIFYQHWEKMKAEIKQMVDQINEWRSARLKEIDFYADEQIRRLATDYSIQRTALDESRRENLETARAFSQSKTDDALKELSDTCKTLKFQVAQLDYARHHSNYPIILTVEDLRRGIKTNKKNVQTGQCENDRDQLVIDNANVRVRNPADSQRSHLQSPLPQDQMK